MPAPKIKLATTAAATQAADLVALPVFEGEIGGKKGPAAVAALSDALGGALEAAAKAEGFKGKAGERLMLHTHGKLKAPRLLVLGLGAAEDGAFDALRDAAATAARTGGAAKAAVVMPERLDDADGVRAAAEGVVLGSYRFDRYLSDADDPARKPLREATLLGGHATKDLKAAAALGAEIGEAVNFARDLVNEPAGVITPEGMAKAARALGKAHGLKVTVKGPRELERLKMGMFLGVAQGSDNEPRLIEIAYQPKGRSKGKGVAFVGKGVCFDSGGYDLKGAEHMLDMKIDMAGAAAALGVMRAVAAIQPPFPVVAYAGAAENLVSGRAYKPGDILKSRKGKTVEINNTDAEGRLILGDVLTYASEQGYDAVIDLATLTGACMIALGPYTVGCLSNDDGLAGEVLGAAERAGESMWRLPLNPALKEQLKSDVADLHNTGERWGGAITAGLFLSEFVGENTKWAHLDIAGPASYGRDKGANGKGASGVGVRTLAYWLMNRK